MSASAAQAAPLSPADQAMLSGEWRTSCNGQRNIMGLRMVIEFAVTGGTVALDDGSEGAGEYRIRQANVTRDRVTLNLGDQGHYQFVREGKTLKGITGDIAGNSFARCRPAADRKNIKLDARALRLLGADMPPDRAIFVDARVRGGCKAAEYQYIAFDLVGPLGFQLRRWNSWALGEKIAAGGKNPFDEVSNFTIDKAESMGGNYRITLTERIPPNGSRGDTTTITVSPTATGMINILEWKRGYRRCPRSVLAAE